ALAAFSVGAIVGGRLANRLGAHRAQLLTAALLVEALLVALSLGLVLAAIASDLAQKYVLIAALAIAMGLPNAAAPRLAVPDLTPTVLTLTLTGFAAESVLAGGSNPRLGRRMIATVAMFGGAAVGAVLLLRVGISAVLAPVLVLLLAALA